MKKMLCLVLGMLMLPGLAIGQDNDDIAKQLKEIKRSRRKMTSDFNRQRTKAESDSEKEAIESNRSQAEIELTGKAIELCRQGENEKLEVTTLSWLTRFAKGKARMLAGDELADKYAKSEHLGVWILALSKVKTPQPETEKWLRAIKDNSIDKDIKGQAVYVLHNHMLNLAEASDDEREYWAESMGKIGEEYLASRTKEKCEKAVEWLGKLCVDDYSDVKFGKTTIGRVFKKKATQTSLAIGKMAPDVIGDDLDGIEFKLSDYRGKVVVLDFWGDW